MSEDSDLTLLRECADQVEVATLRSLLDAHGVRYVVQGEHHSSLVGGPFGNPAILPRILVAKARLAEAQRLLEAVPLDTGPEHDGTVPEGALCPVHEQQAIATCDKCGTFLCGSCHALGNPPVCEDCSKRDDAALAARAEGTNKVRRGVTFVMLGGFALAIGYPLVRMLLRWLGLLH